MHWLLIACAAPFLWALVNLADQYLVERYSSGPRGSGGLVLFSSLIGVCAAFVIGTYTDNVWTVPFLDKILLVATGGLTIAWIILYLSALEVEDVSAVVPWFLTIPVFGYVLGYFFLGETLSARHIAGSIIVLTGVFLVSFDFSSSQRKFKWRPALAMSLACVLVAVSGTLFKYVAIESDFWRSSFWEYAGLGFFGILLYGFVPSYRRQFHAMNRKGGVKIFLLNTVSEILTVVGNLLTNYAMLLAPVAMVYLVGSFQPAIVLVLSLLAAWLVPGLIREDISLRSLAPKIVSVCIIVIGSAVLFL